MNEEKQANEAMEELQPGETLPSWPAVAPVWHTIVLIAAVVTMSVRQGMQGEAAFQTINRLATYGWAALMDLLLVGWVWFGLRLRRMPLRVLLGEFSFSPQALLRDAGVALLFWLAALFVLGSCATFWAQSEARLQGKRAADARNSLAQPTEAQRETLGRLKELAPSNTGEMAAWVGLCLLVGFSEELVFRGYLQQQLLAATRGRETVAVIASACLFGMGHAYQGARGVVLIGVFGTLFGVLALMRRSLRPGMMAHTGHDLLAGLALALLRSHHLI